MSILKYKYKAHKLINTLFYAVVFGIGFILGFGAEKIDFNKLVSQVLMIDNAKAYTITTTSSGEVINEDFIISKFSSYISNFDVTDYEFAYYKWSGQQYWTVYAIVKENIHLATQSSSNGTLGYGSVDCNSFTGKPCYYSFNIRTSGSEAVKPISSGGVTIQYSNFDSLSQYNTNFTYDYSTKNVLDFSKLEFNENLFKDNPDFKEVCVDKTDKFLITPVDYGENNEISTADFIWFPYKISGFYGSSIDNDNIIGKNTSDEYRFYFNSKEAINEEFTEDGLQYLLTIVSYYYYENRYSYYGWSAHPFNLFYNQNNDNYYSFPYFYFENPEMYKLDGSKIENEESLPFDDYLSYDNEEICFYIRNKFNVEILNKDLNDNDYIDLTLPGGSVHINKDTSNFSSGLFTSITKFINEVSDCLDLIKDNIYNFYLSMPYLLRLFIVSTFTVLIVKFIIGMVVK